MTEIPWLDELRRWVEKTRLVILKLDETEWEHLLQSRRGVNEFTIAKRHELVSDVKAPAVCLVSGKSPDDERNHLGVISSRSAVTTLESRMKITRCREVMPQSTNDLVRLAAGKAKGLGRDLRSRASVVTLSLGAGAKLIEELATIESNHGVMRTIAASLTTPVLYMTNSSLQLDAIRSALAALRISPNGAAHSLELVAGRESTLAGVNIMEDAVIEHDARQIPGYDLVGSDITGRAVFEAGGDVLEVYTANRRPLEECFGVDLIYLNASRQSLVMLQYKMLEWTKEGNVNDWIYRPDAKLEKQIQRMRTFAANHAPGPFEYRLNPDVFFLKFVKRSASIGDGVIITPLDHFQKLREDPACKGPRGAFRVSFKSLEGRYLRQGAFLDLLRSGYIGAHAETTRELKTLIDGVLKGNRAVIAAIQNTVAEDDDE